MLLAMSGSQVRLVAMPSAQPPAHPPHSRRLRCQASYTAVCTRQALRPTEAGLPWLIWPTWSLPIQGVAGKWQRGAVECLATP
jgi:hypothetical protein